MFMGFWKSVILSAVALIVFNLNGCTCGRKSPPAESTTTAPQSEAMPDPNKAPDYSGITVNRVLTTDLAPGKGAEAKVGSVVTGTYKMWVYAPKELGNKGKAVGESSKDGSSFEIGKGEVVKGFEEGVIGMKAGGKRSIIIPVELGYGEGGNDRVPPNSILLVEFELTKVK